MIESEELKKYEEYSKLVRNIEMIDLKLKRLFYNEYVRDRNEWWRNVILKYAGDEYSLDVKGLYNAIV